MANYSGTGRSNYIHVTDLEMIKKIADIYQLCVRADETDPTYVYFYSVSEDGDIETYYTVSNWAYAEKYEDIFGNLPKDCLEFGDAVELPDFMDTIAKYMVEEEVFIWQHVGSEKLRYLNGYAVAINAKGKHVSISIDEIYNRAKQLGIKISEATY